jgi:hypothetical protein
MDNVRVLVTDKHWSFAGLERELKEQTSANSLMHKVKSTWVTLPWN